MSKLWQVTIERSILVLADTEDDAEELALKHERDEQCNDADFVHAIEVTDIKRVPKDWRNGIPYGAESNETCAQILDTQAVATDFNNENQGKLI